MKGIAFGLLSLMVVACALYYQQKLFRFYNVLVLFQEDKIVEQFRTMCHLGFDCRVAHRGKSVAAFIDDTEGRQLPATFFHNHTTYDLRKFLEDHYTTGLVVLHIDDVTKARVLYEEYWRGTTKQSKVISWSVGKSFVSALFGIAVEEFGIDIQAKVTQYAPELRDSGYKDVIIKDVLQMSSGIQFNEDYFDFFSDINVMGRTLALGGSINGFVASLKSNRPPGTYNHYVSMDTQVLAIVLSHVINTTLTEYLEAKVWSKGGFESDIHWLLDNNYDKMELAFGGLNGLTRDYARFGWLYANMGRSPLDGGKIVPEQWIRDSTTPDAPHLMPGINDVSDFPFGYGYQWWIPGRDDRPNEVNGDFLAIGVYNQFIYISPSKKIVIARNSAYAHYEENALVSELEAVSCFRAIAKHFGERA